MKVKIVGAVLVLVVLCVACLGCSAKDTNDIIKCKVTLYDDSGKVIKVWDDCIETIVTYGKLSFNYNGKDVVVSGTYIVEEK